MKLRALACVLAIALVSIALPAGAEDPAGYRGDIINDLSQLEEKIVGLAEAWTAVREHRPYRPALARAEALETIAATSGTWFTPELIKALRAAV